MAISCQSCGHPETHHYAPMFSGGLFLDYQCAVVEEMTTDGKVKFMCGCSGFDSGKDGDGDNAARVAAFLDSIFGSASPRH